MKSASSRTCGTASSSTGPPASLRNPALLKQLIVKGTGGFLCTAYQYVLDRNARDLDADEKRTLREGLIEGMKLSPKVGRMCAMKLYLHGIGSESAVVMYSPGVKANVLFFDKKEGRAEAWTDKLWVYDLRTNQHFTLKQKPIRRSDFDEFVACYKPGRMHERAETWSEVNPEGRWRSFDYDELLKRDKLSLDLLTWTPCRPPTSSLP